MCFPRRSEVQSLIPRFREVVAATLRTEGRFKYGELPSLYASAQLHKILHQKLGSSLVPFSPLSPCILALQIVPERRQTHTFNLSLSQGTQEVSRSRQGGARPARPHAREPGSSARLTGPMLTTQDSRPAPQDCRPKHQSGEGFGRWILTN